MRVKNLCVKDYIVKGVKLKFSKNCWGEGISVGVWGITSDFSLGFFPLSAKSWKVNNSNPKFS